MVKYLAVAFLVIVASPLSIADDAYESDRIEFVVGNVVFVMLHEFSHLIIEDFDVPVLGNITKTTLPTTNSILSDSSVSSPAIASGKAAISRKAPARYFTARNRLCLTARGFLRRNNNVAANAPFALRSFGIF